MKTTSPLSAEERARFVSDRLPPNGLFAGMDWRIATTPFPLGSRLASELESLGRVLLQFYRAVNQLYRQSVAGRQPAWVAEYLDRGKDPKLIELQRSSAFKADVPRVIRPDILLTDEGLCISELDSVPGGIGLTAWLNTTYSALASRGTAHDTAGDSSSVHASPSPLIIGGERGMLEGFAGIFGEARRVHLVVSEESATYRPEMEWVAQQLNAASAGSREFTARDSRYTQFAPGDAVYRFFELFDLANIASAPVIFEMASRKDLDVTPPPKPIFEEKLLFALLWNRNLRGFWRQELGEGFLRRLLAVVPYTWILDPAPLPPTAAIPRLELTDWHQLKSLSQKERNLILKVSGYSDQAWGARGVYLGSDLSHADWSEAVDNALRDFTSSPSVLQEYHKPRTIDTSYFDLVARQEVIMPGRVRLCPYYFVHGSGDASRAVLSGALATICPADKKIIHGMKEAVLAPCSG